MAFPYSVHKTYVTGEVLTASDLNSTDVNHVNNNVPESTDDYSVNLTEMQSTVDPYPGASESLATTLAGELERLRYQIKEILGETQWYIDPDNTIAALEADKAEDSAVVHLAGSESITGQKTFTENPGIIIQHATEGTLDLKETNNTIIVRSRATNTGSGSYIGTDTNHDFSIIANNVYSIKLDASNGSAVAIKGSSTNDSASAGYVGEHKESKSSTPANFPTSGNYGDAGSLSLTAGDWDVSFVLEGQINTATWSRIDIGISAYNGNDTTGLSGGDNLIRHIFASSNTTPIRPILVIPSFRVSLASPTTYYAKIFSSYSAGQPQYVYRISARRVR